MESVPVFQDQRPSSINTAVKMDKDASPNAKEILRRISPQRQQLLEQRVTRKVFSAIPSADKNVHAQDSPVASKAGAGQAAHSTPQPERRVRKRRTPVKSTLALQKKRESSSLQPSSTKSRAHRKPTPSPPRPNVTKRDADSMSQLSQRTTSTELNGSRSNSRTSPFEIDTGSNSHSRSFFRPSSRSQSRDGHRVVSSPMKKGNSQPTPIDMSKMVIDEAGWIKHGPEDGHGDLSGRNSRGASSAIATTPEKGFRDNEASNGSTSGRSSPRNSRKRGQSGGNNASAAGLSLEKKIAKKRNRLDGRTSANSSRDGFPLSVEDVPSNQPSITSFFMGSNTAAGAAPPSGSSAIPVGATPPGLITTKRGVAPTACSNAAPSTPTAISNRVGDKFARQQVEMLQAKLVNEVEKNSSLASENERLRQLVKSLETDLQDARSGVEQLQQTQQNRVTRMRTFFESILREKIALERSKALQDIAQQNVAVGRVIYVRSGARVQDMWCDGEEFLTLNREKARVKRDREELELQKKDIAKQFRKAKADSKTASKASASSAHLVELEGSMRPPTAAGAAVTQTPEWGRLVEREESIRMALNDVKRREQSLTAQEEALRTRKKMHWLNIKRVSDFAESRFSQWSKPLNNRYVLVDLLGKGGFSEVWKAVDLVNFRFVACKIHQLSQGWSEAKMANYTKHATREYAIHKALRHERVVPLYDVFEIDKMSFATVLEYCPGPDLSMYLKENNVLPEKEARGIIIQVLSALKYLADQKKIIHYDLKPANILFVKPGEIKITDFGLSKIMPDNADDSRMELTSQGAGTYWYLPPECFMTSAPPRISSKVDVWSVGVIFYQMLFGKRPFGDGMSQDTIMQQGTMLQARLVKFPDSIKCSVEAKEFMLACLQHNQDRRASIDMLYNHKYITQRLK